MRGRRGAQHPGTVGTRAVLVLVLVCLLSLVASPPAGADITYVYDVGRLIGVVDPVSDTVVYSYDAVGNLLGIARYASSTVSVIDFQPKSGPIGTTVTIQGTGFSPTPANNTVTFNGSAAAVTSATATSLVVTVPSGSTTGMIGVTAPGGSAASGSAFTVTATNGAPTISGFSPAVGLPGDTTTLSGTNFDTVPPNNKVAFYRAPDPRPKALVTAATATTLDAVVPPNARSGPVTLATPGGTTVSPADFFVPMNGYTAAQTIFTGRITLGGASVDVPMTTPSRQGLVVFDGVAGQRLNLGVVTVSGGGGPSVTMYRPDGSQLLGVSQRNLGTWTSFAQFTPPLPMSGVYVIVLTNSGYSHTVRLTLSEEVTATAVVGGTPANVSLPRVGQRARVSFSGTAGQRIDLGLTHSLSVVTASLKTADEATTLLTMDLSTPSELHSTLPATATYALIVEPQAGSPWNFTPTLSQELTGTITIDGASLPLTIDRAGQRARVSFSGTAGQTLTLGLTSASSGGQVTVFGPNGVAVAAPTNFTAPAASVNPPTLVATGTHEILVDFSSTNTGGVTLWLSQVIWATTALDGTPLLVNITRPGQRAVVTYPATAGHRVSHAFSGATFSGIVLPLRPNGTWLSMYSLLPGVTFHEPYPLPATETVNLLVNPNAAATGSVTIASYDVPADATGSVSINGGTVPVTVSVPGQNALLSFAATSGQGITVRITGNTLGCPYVSIVPPSGGSIGGTSSCSASFNLTGSVVTTTGTHTVKIDPQGAATGGATVEVTQP